MWSTLMETFDEVIKRLFLDQLYDFRRSDFQRSDQSPYYYLEGLETDILINLMMGYIYLGDSQLKFFWISMLFSSKKLKIKMNFFRLNSQNCS